MAFTRRRFLLGIGGAVVGLPFLEGLAPKKAHADNTFPPFALFYRRGNGVQQRMFGQKNFGQFNQKVLPDLVHEPERWWPVDPTAEVVIPQAPDEPKIPTFGDYFGPLTAQILNAACGGDCALSELAAYASQLTVIRGLRHPVGTQLGHPEGFAQGLTGAGVKYPNDVPRFDQCAPLGESLDNRIARELTPDYPTSLYFTHGTNHKELGTGSDNVGFVSWENSGVPGSPATTRVGVENLISIYNAVFLPQAGDATAQQLLHDRRVSVNDLVRDQLVALRADPRLSAEDRARLDMHTSSIRDTEVALACVIPPTLQGDVTTTQALINADLEYYKGHTVAAAGAMIARLAALAIVCGRRSILLNMGEPQDVTQYYEVPGASVTDFHSISHRLVDDDPLKPIGNAMNLHHAVDRFHLQVFRGILDEIAKYPADNGQTMLDKGVCVHYADLGSGQHERYQLPYLYVGGAGGNLVTGQYIKAFPTTAAGAGADVLSGEFLVKFLNSIGAAVGVKNGSGGATSALDNFNADNNHDPPDPANHPLQGPAITGRLDSIYLGQP